MTKEYIKEIPNWEKDYLDTMKDSLSKQQIELLNGRYIKADEGMIYGETAGDEPAKTYEKNRQQFKMVKLETPSWTIEVPVRKNK